MASLNKNAILNIVVLAGFAVSALAWAAVFLTQTALAFAGNLLSRGISLEFIVGARDYERPVARRRPF